MPPCQEIAILSDQTLFRQGLAEILQKRGCRHICEYSSRAKLVEAAALSPPDVVLIDLDHEDEDTATVVHRLRHDLAGSQIIVIGTPLRQGAISNAAPGVETPKSDVSALVSAIALAPLGLPFSPAATKYRRLWSHITPRQRDVLRWLSTGMDNEAIARKLRVGIRAVKAHVSTLLQTFGLKNRTELALLADHAGLRPPARRLEG